MSIQLTHEHPGRARNEPEPTSQMKRFATQASGGRRVDERHHVSPVGRGPSAPARTRRHHHLDREEQKEAGRTGGAHSGEWS